jgi:hypothetical protein
MPCKPCEQFKEERIREYIIKFGLSRSDAEQRFKNIKPLIDRVVEGRHLHYSPYKFLQGLIHSFKVWNVTEQRYVLVDVDPDYVQDCIQGTCAGVDPNTTCTKAGLPCTISANCADGSCQVTGSCGCPAPKANSTQVSGCSYTCVAIGVCARCIGPTGEKYCEPSCSRITCSDGTCGYNCTPPRVWNGVACVLPPSVKAGLHPSKPLAIILNE